MSRWDYTVMMSRVVVKGVEWRKAGMQWRRQSSKQDTRHEIEKKKKKKKKKRRGKVRGGKALSGASSFPSLPFHLCCTHHTHTHSHTQSNHHQQFIPKEAAAYHHQRDILPSPTHQNDELQHKSFFLSFFLSSPCIKMLNAFTGRLSHLSSFLPSFSFYADLFLDARPLSFKSSSSSSSSSQSKCLCDRQAADRRWRRRRRRWRTGCASCTCICVCMDIYIPTYSLSALLRAQSLCCSVLCVVVVLVASADRQRATAAAMPPKSKAAARSLAPPPSFLLVLFCVYKQLGRTNPPTTPTRTRHTTHLQIHLFFFFKFYQLFSRNLGSNQQWETPFFVFNKWMLNRMIGSDVVFNDAQTKACARILLTSLANDGISK